MKRGSSANTASADVLTLDIPASWTGKTISVAYKPSSQSYFVIIAQVQWVTILILYWGFLGPLWSVLLTTLLLQHLHSVPHHVKYWYWPLPISLALSPSMLPSAHKLQPRGPSTCFLNLPSWFWSLSLCLCCSLFLECSSLSSLHAWILLNVWVRLSWPKDIFPDTLSK